MILLAGVRAVNADGHAGDVTCGERDRSRVYIRDAQAAADDHERGRQGVDPDLPQQPGPTAVRLVRRPEDVGHRLRGDRADVQHCRRRAESKAIGVRLAARWLAARRLSWWRASRGWPEHGTPSAATPAAATGLAARAARAARAAHSARTRSSGGSGGCRHAELAPRAVLEPGPDARRRPLSAVLPLAPAAPSRLSSPHVALAPPTVVRARSTSSTSRTPSPRSRRILFCIRRHFRQVFRDSIPFVDSPRVYWGETTRSRADALVGDRSDEVYAIYVVYKEK